MGRIVVTEYISVDGVVEAPSGTEDFERVDWTDDFSRCPEGDACLQLVGTRSATACTCSCTSRPPERRAAANRLQ